LTSLVFRIADPQILIRDLGISAQLAIATRDHSTILVRVMADAERDRGEIQLLFGWNRDLGRR
jgi:hypothetical protein